MALKASTGLLPDPPNGTTSTLNFFQVAGGGALDVPGVGYTADIAAIIHPNLAFNHAAGDRGQRYPMTLFRIFLTRAATCNQQKKSDRAEPCDLGFFHYFYENTNPLPAQCGKELAGHNVSIACPFIH